MPELYERICAVIDRAKTEADEDTDTYAAAIIAELQADRPAALPVTITEDGLSCPAPDCSSNDIQAAWETTSVCRVELADGVIAVHYDSQKHIGDTATENTYECARCCTPVTLPAGIEIAE